MDIGTISYIIMAIFTSIVVYSIILYRESNKKRSSRVFSDDIFEGTGKLALMIFSLVVGGFWFATVPVMIVGGIVYYASTKIVEYLNSIKGKN